MAKEIVPGLTIEELEKIELDPDRKAIAEGVIATEEMIEVRKAQLFEQVRRALYHGERVFITDEIKELGLEEKIREIIYMADRDYKMLRLLQDDYEPEDDVDFLDDSSSTSFLWP